MLSVMGSCGMYDAAGEWIYQVGIPAKSGVAGGILAVLPGQLGIGVFSPRLDARGNSVRGIEVCRELSQRLNLHLFNSTRPALSVIRNITTAAEMGSKRIRSAADLAVLQKNSGRIRHIHIQGELQFASAERVVRETLRQSDLADHLLLNFKHAPTTDGVAAQLLAGLAATLVTAGKTLTFSGGPVLRRYDKARKSRYADLNQTGVEFIEDYELALENLEKRVLAEGSRPGWASIKLEPHECELFANLDADARRLLAGLFQKKFLCRRGAYHRSREHEPLDNFYSAGLGGCMDRAARAGAPAGGDLLRRHGSR